MDGHIEHKSRVGPDPTEDRSRCLRVEVALPTFGHFTAAIVPAGLAYGFTSVTCLVAVGPVPTT